MLFHPPAAHEEHSEDSAREDSESKEGAPAPNQLQKAATFEQTDDAEADPAKKKKRKKRNRKKNKNKQPQDSASEVSINDQSVDERSNAFMDDSVDHSRSNSTNTR